MRTLIRPQGGVQPRAALLHVLLLGEVHEKAAWTSDEMFRRQNTFTRLRLDKPGAPPPRRSVKIVARPRPAYQTGCGTPKRRL